MDPGVGMVLGVCVHGPGGVSGPGGVWSRGVWSWGVLVETPLETATAAGSTHPTGMHSCYIIILSGGIDVTNFL